MSDFEDPLQLLNHLRNELLPICASARCYEFTIRFCFFCHYVSATNMLDAILQMPSIVSSTNVKFSFHQFQPYDYGHGPYGANTTLFLPVAAISAWLNRNSNGMIIKSRKQQKSPIELTVYIDSYVQVQNVQELFEHLKKVGSFSQSFT